MIVDFLLNYGDHEFISQLDLTKIQPAPAHYIGWDGSERIADLIFLCPLKNGERDVLAVIIFEHQSESLKDVPLKLLKYISAFWDAERKAGKKFLSIPYFLVLRTGKKPHTGPLAKISDNLPKDAKGRSLGKTVELEYDIVDLPTWSFDDLLGEAPLRFVIGVLKTMTEGTIDEFLAKAFLPLAELEDGELKYELLRKALIQLDKAAKAHNHRLDEQKLREAVKPVFKEPERSENMIVSLFEEKILVGEVKGKVETIILILADRFDGVSKDLERKIQKINDIKKLNELSKLSAKCESLYEFENALD